MTSPTPSFTKKRTKTTRTTRAYKPRTSRLDTTNLTIRKRTATMCETFFQSGKQLGTIVKEFGITPNTLRVGLRKYTWVNFPEIMDKHATDMESVGKPRWASLEFFIANKAEFRRALNKRDKVADIEKDDPPAPAGEKDTPLTNASQAVPINGDVIKISPLLSELLYSVSEDLKQDVNASIQTMVGEFYESRGYVVRMLENDTDFEIVKKKRRRADGQK